MQFYKHQQRVIDENPPRCLLAHEVGTGKTITSLELARKNNITPLIICPKMLLEKWRRDAKNAGVVAEVVTKEYFRAHHEKLQPHQAVIIDEAHLGFANFKSQLHKAALAYFKRCGVVYVWLLTGTPYTSSPWAIYSLARLVGVKLDYMEFRYKFFNERYFGRRVVWEPKKGIEDEIAALVKTFGSIVRLDECIDVPDQQYLEESYEMTKEQEREIEEVYANESNPLARFTKLHQIASGVLLGNEFVAPKSFACLKNDRIVELAQENDKVAVFCRYNHHIDHLAERLTAEGIPVRIIRGDTPNRDEVVQEVEAMGRVVVLINSSCSAGYELPSIGVIIFASLSYSFVDFVQSQGRFLRINKPKKNVYITITTKDSADEPVKAAIDRKESFSEAIYYRGEARSTIPNPL